MENMSSVDTKHNSEPALIENTNHIRKYLLVLVTIQWILTIVGLAFRIYSTMIEDNNLENEFLLSLFALTFYYAFGLVVIYKYHHVGIRIFAWIGVCLYALWCILIGYFVLAITTFALDFNNLGLLFRFLIVFAFIFIAFSTVVILTIKLAFKLAKAIKLIGDISV